jgi:hypothetical protein
MHYCQDYYRLARMVSLFIDDLTKEKMPDLDDLLDGSKGQSNQQKKAKKVRMSITKLERHSTIFKS